MEIFGVEKDVIYSEGRGKIQDWGSRDWGSSLRLTLVEKYQRSNVDLTPNF